MNQISSSFSESFHLPLPAVSAFIQSYLESCKASNVMHPDMVPTIAALENTLGKLNVLYRMGEEEVIVDSKLIEANDKGGLNFPLDRLQKYGLLFVCKMLDDYFRKYEGNAFSRELERIAENPHRIRI